MKNCFKLVLFATVMSCMYSCSSSKDKTEEVFSKVMEDFKKDPLDAVSFAFDSYSTKKIFQDSSLVLIRTFEHTDTVFKVGFIIIDLQTKQSVIVEKFLEYKETGLNFTRSSWEESSRDEKDYLVHWSSEEAYAEFSPLFQLEGWIDTTYQINMYILKKESLRITWKEPNQGWMFDDNYVPKSEEFPNFVPNLINKIHESVLKK